MLIVEDDPLITSMLVRSLKKVAPDPHCEREAAAAIRMLETGSFDVVWSDLDLGPGASGIDLLERARAMQPAALLMIVSGNLDLLPRRGPPDGTRVFAKTQVEEALSCVRAHAEKLGFVVR